MSDTRGVSAEVRAARHIFGSYNARDASRHRLAVSIIAPCLSALDQAVPCTVPLGVCVSSLRACICDPRFIAYHSSLPNLPSKRDVRHGGGASFESHVLPRFSV